MITLLKTLYHKHQANKILKEHIDYDRDKHEDRNVLETIIFPFVLAKYNPKTILDIGREDYQSFYNEFFSGRELWTIDMDPERTGFGHPERHIVDNAANIKKYFHINQFDFILMNGVFGWGLDREEEVQQAFESIYRVLKPGGLFILGWNDAPVPLEQIKGLNKLEKIEFQPLKKHCFECINGNHKYNFYTKP